MSEYEIEREEFVSPFDEVHGSNVVEFTISLAGSQADAIEESDYRISGAMNGSKGPVLRFEKVTDE